MPFVDYSSSLGSILTELRNSSLNIQNVKVAIDGVNSVNTDILSNFNNLLAYISQKEEKILIDEEVERILNPFYRISEHSRQAMATAIENSKIQGQGQEDNQKVLSQTLNPIVSGIQQIATQRQSSPVIDYSNNIAAIITELKNTSVNIQNVKVAVDNLSSNFTTLGEAMKNSGGGNTFNVEINQTGFNIQQKSDADNVARLTESAIRQGLGNGGI